MTGTFKANNPYNTFLLLVYGILLKLPVFLHPAIPQPQQTDGFLYKALLKWLQPFGTAFPIIYGIITFTLLYSQAVSFNKLANDLRLMKKQLLNRYELYLVTFICRMEYAFGATNNQLSFNLGLGTYEWFVQRYQP